MEMSAEEERESQVPLAQKVKAENEFLEGVEKPGYGRLPLLVKEVEGKGRGVFTREFIAKGDVVELAPVIAMDKDQYQNHIAFTDLEHYVYKWEGGGCGVSLGIGSLFNHSSKPNVGWTRLFGPRLLKYVALRDILPHEELLISYGPKVWFPTSPSSSPPLLPSEPPSSDPFALSDFDLDL